ncbi:uncharacterized protein [Diabrotica undecimpunctata]
MNNEKEQKGMEEHEEDVKFISDQAINMDFLSDECDSYADNDNAMFLEKQKMNNSSNTSKSEFIEDDDDSIKDPNYIPSEDGRAKKKWFSNLKIPLRKSHPQICEELVDSKQRENDSLILKKVIDIAEHGNDVSSILFNEPIEREKHEKDKSLIVRNLLNFDNKQKSEHQMEKESEKEQHTSSSTVAQRISSVALEDKPLVEKTLRKNYKDRRDFCFYCEKDVSHFSRHISKWHSEEIDVVKILCHKVNSKERRLALSNLRKKGNFIRNRTDSALRPVKRPKLTDKSLSADQYLPCKYCLGYYKKKFLFRHTKICLSNYDKENNRRQTSQSDGQTTLLLHHFLKHDDLLKSKIFSRMRADDINLIAKKDPLICQYAYSYIKGRQSKGNIDLVRQNMRRLAKLLDFARLQNPDIKKLIDILRPKHFQLIISGVNKIAKYNPETDNYESPTLAINFGTLIKKCCDLAYINLVQIENTSDERKELKILKTLLESQWCNEVSAQACTNLNQNKWNKEELLPLTNDLKKLNIFLQTSSEELFHKLKSDENDFKIYNSLKDTLYAQVILLNRRRPAEVAQLKVQTFKSINLGGENDNEFEKCLTEAEKILLKTYSRLVIRGKRGRGVPILLSPSMKMHFDLILQCRNNFAIESDFVFHTTGRGFVDGTKIIHKYAKKCQLERPASITATKLRKHLATITQLLQFSNNDMEQLSKFMGHTLQTHCNYYRLSDKVYQTAKISKLLLLMMEGGAEKYKGKTLDEIDINLAPLSDAEEEEMENILDTNDNLTVDCKIPSTSADLDNNKEPHKKMRNLKKKRFIDRRRPWTKQQKSIIAEYFSDNIKNRKPPIEIEVKHLIEEYPEVFKERKWTCIKAVVYNMYTGKLKY